MIVLLRWEAVHGPPEHIQLVIHTSAVMFHRTKCRLSHFLNAKISSNLRILHILHFFLFQSNKVDDFGLGSDPHTSEADGLQIDMDDARMTENTWMF